MSASAHTDRPRSAARRWVGGRRAWCAAAVLLGGLVASLGCGNPIGALGFILNQAYPNTGKPKLCPLTIEGKESKVLILATHQDAMPNNLTFRDAHREL